VEAPAERLGAAAHELRHPIARALRRQQINLGSHQEHVHGSLHHVRVDEVHGVHRERPVEYGLMDSARHIIGCRLIQETRVRSALGDVASDG